MTFNEDGHTDEINAHTYDYVVIEKDENGNEKKRIFRFFAQPIQKEDKGKLPEKQGFIEDYNMVVYLIQEQGLSETIWTDIMEKLIYGTI